MRFLSVAVCLTALCACSRTMLCQGNSVAVYERPLHVRHFSGTVFNQRGMTVEYATVEVHEPKTHRLLASTFADAEGSFFFDDKIYGKRIEIRVIEKGFHIAQYIAIRRPFGDEHLRLMLTEAN